MQEGDEKVVSATKQEYAYREVLKKHYNARVQVVGDVILDEAKKAGLYDILRPEIVAFLDHFHGVHEWKKHYVSTTFNRLRSEIEKHGNDDRRVLVMEFAGEMADLIKSTFPADDVIYRAAMSGLGRIVEIVVNWQSSLKNSDIPKFSGIKLDGDPITFLQKHYGRWLADGQLSQITLRQRDERLLNALKYKLRQNG